MKHLFIVNPAAGSVNHAQEIRLALSRHLSDSETEIEIYETKEKGDAVRYVRQRLAASPDTTLRIYACGGDGTLCEVVNGVVGFSNAEVACYPCGSGNDFVKYYGGKDVFLNLEDLMAGSAVNVDLMYTGKGYSINVTNFGFDTSVAKTMAEVKYKKIIGGKNAYTTGIVKALFTSMRNRCTVSVDGETLGNGTMLLCTVANGRYVGGSYCCAPRSVNDDGLLEVCYVKPLSLFTFLRLIGCYAKGEHLDDPRFSKYIEYRRGKEVHVKAPKGFSYSLDGEILSDDDFSIRVVPGALRFVLPRDFFKET